MKKAMSVMVIVSVVAVCLTVQSCGKAADKPVIGLSVLSETNPFFGEIADGMKAEAAKHGYEVVVVSGDFDVDKQKNQVSDFIVQKVAAIVLCPCDSKSIGTSIKKANEAGIPVFTADIACIAEDAKVVSHIATDNYGGGRMAAKAMIEALGGTGKIAILDHPEVESVIQRTKGFKDELAQATKEKGVKIEIVAQLPSGGTEEKGFSATEDILQRHPDLDGIFAINDPSAMGSIQAIERAGKTGKIKVVGFDGQLIALQAIKDGKIYADAIQYPKRIGAITVQTIVKYVAGEQVDSEILIPTGLYRQEDAKKDPRLKK